MTAKTYRINEVFYSLQGEGIRAGTPNVFIRFSGCNLRCSVEPGGKSPGGFDCDTEFESGRKVTLDELHCWAQDMVGIATRVTEVEDSPGIDWLILTGGEPGLQVDKQFVDYWHDLEVRVAIETNGTICLDGLGLDWITLSPKVAEHAVKQLKANELKYVRGFGQGIPKPAAIADHYLLSPAFDGLNVDERTIQWCIRLCLENPSWRLSLQQHKFLKIR